MSQTDLSGMKRVVEAAARKGVELDIRVLGGAVHGVDEAAAAVGTDPRHVVQAVVFAVSHLGAPASPIVCLVSGRDHVDPGLLAAVLGETTVRRATPTEVLDFTGFPAAVVPPFGFPRSVRVVMDQDLGSSEWLWAVAGSDTAMLRLTPGVLRMLSNAMVTPLAAAPWVAPAAVQNSVGALEALLRLDAASQA